MNNINIKILSAFLIVVIVLGFFIRTCFNNSKLAYVEIALAVDDLQYINSVEAINNNIQLIETGYRNYLITREQKYFDQSNVNIGNTINNLEITKTMIKEDSSKTKTFETLTSLVYKKIEFSKNALTLIRKNKITEATALIRTSEGFNLMKNIGSIITQIKIDSNKDFYLNMQLQTKQITKIQNNFIVLSSFTLLVLFVFYFIIITDLRKNSKIRESLQIANEKANNLFDYSPSAYIIVDNELKITQLNKTALEWIGIPYEEIILKKNFSEFVNNQSSQSMQHILTNDSDSNLEIEILGKNKNRSVILDLITRHDSIGNTIEKRIMLTDITERKKAENEHKYLATLINQTSDGIFSTDKNFIIRSWNKGAENMFGYKANEVINKNAIDLPHNLSKEDIKSITKILYEKGIWRGEFTYYKKDGTPLPVITSVSAVTDNDENITGYVSVVQDITHLRQLEATLRNFNTELIEKINQKIEELYHTLERLTDGFISLDKDLKITYVNDIGAKLLGKEKHELIGINPSTAFMHENNASMMACSKAFLTQSKVETEDYYEYFKRWYNCMVYPSIDGATIIFRDTTEQKEIKQKIIESEIQYRKLFENNPLPMIIADLDNFIVLDVNNAAVNLYGYSIEEFKNINVINLRPEEEKLRFIEYNKNNRGKSTNAGIWKHLKKDGSIIHVNIQAYDTKYDNKNARLVIINDITEKLISDNELRNSRDQLRELTTHLENIKEEERIFLAREIHDELGQLLTGLKMDISWLSKRIPDEPKGAKDKIDGMMVLVDETVKSVRKIASRLRPEVLDDIGLTAALDWHTHEFKKRTGIDCTFQSNIEELSLDKSISTGIFRIMQEALTNVARHSEATKVKCNLSILDNQLKLTINDNGSGISKISMNQKTLGIVGMKERAYMMKGTLEIASESGKGTKVELTVPLDVSNN